VFTSVEFRRVLFRAGKLRPGRGGPDRALGRAVRLRPRARGNDGLPRTTGSAMGAVSTADRAERVPKQDRSRATRQRLLEAAVACLAEHGWAGSTVSVVAERAAGSRGAAQHHFPTRQDPLTAPVEHGWAGSTVSVVAERAGVSRGAAQHHFPTREDLFTAAVEYVAEERSTALRALFADGPDGPGGPDGSGGAATGDRRAVVAALV